MFSDIDKIEGNNSPVPVLPFSVKPLPELLLVKYTNEKKNTTNWTYLHLQKTQTNT